MQSSTTSIPTARRTCCCSACSIRAGSSSSSPSTRPTQVRGLSEPDRALVEDHALLSAEGPTLRDLGRDRASRRTRHRLLERAQTSLHLGPSPASSDAPAASASPLSPLSQGLSGCTTYTSRP